jgi:ABC-2 type transport system ATP-binding protein
MSWGLDGVTVRLGGRKALDGVTVVVEPSSVAVLVGGDGSGKSTCLRAMVGLVRPSAGTVRRPPKQEVGYIPATAGLYPDLTVDENVSFAAGAFGLTGRALATRSGELLERIGLGDARHRLGGQLSGGMQRKLAVVMALLHRPTLLVLDEPTTGVDPVSRAEVWRLISGAAAGGAAVVVSTTYVDEGRRASSVTLLESGGVIGSGSPADIVAAVPGTVGVVRSAARPPGPAWRWGSAWRVWAPTGALPDGAEPRPPEFEDAVVIAALAAEAGP